MTDNPPGYVVEPTAQSAGDRHTDIAKTGLFNACVSVVNSERQTIWQRYNAMLVGNAVVLAFQRGSPAHSFENLIGSGSHPTRAQILIALKTYSHIDVI